MPLDDRKNVFLSYNFEANYNSPYQGSDYIPGPLTRVCDFWSKFAKNAFRTVNIQIIFHFS